MGGEHAGVLLYGVARQGGAAARRAPSPRPERREGPCWEANTPASCWGVRRSKEGPLILAWREASLLARRGTQRTLPFRSCGAGTAPHQGLKASPSRRESFPPISRAHSQGRAASLLYGLCPCSPPFVRWRNAPCPRLSHSPRVHGTLCRRSARTCSYDVILPDPHVRGASVSAVEANLLCLSLLSLLSDDAGRPSRCPPAPPSRRPSLPCAQHNVSTVDAQPSPQGVVVFVSGQVSGALAGWLAVHPTFPLQLMVNGD